MLSDGSHPNRCGLAQGGSCHSRQKATPGPLVPVLGAILVQSRASEKKGHIRRHTLLDVVFVYRVSVFTHLNSSNSTRQQTYPYNTVEGMQGSVN